MKRILVALMVTMVTTAVAAPPCWACSCVPSTKKEKAKNADVIFTGTVLEITQTDGGDDSYDPLKVQFKVAKVYKGYPREITHVYTEEWGSMCGASFDEGKKYTVFADKHDGKKWTSMCSGTKQGGINPDNYGLGKSYPPQD